MSPDRNQFLLIFHAKFGKWIQPGGHFDIADGSLYNTALRELSEETGLQNVVSLNQIDICIHEVPPNPRKSEPEHLHLDVGFWLQSQTWDVSPGDDAKDAKWFPVEDIDLTVTDASVCRSLTRWLAKAK